MGGNGIDYDFSDYKTFNELFNDLYNRKMTINDPENIQNRFKLNIFFLKRYKPRFKEYIEAKYKLLDNVKNVYNGKEIIIEGFKNGLFLQAYEFQVEKKKQMKKQTHNPTLQIGRLI